LETLEKIFERGSDALDDMISEHHVIALAAVKGLIVKGFLLVAVVVTVRYSVRYGPDDVSIAAVLHPGVQTYLYILDVCPCGNVSGQQGSVWGVVV
jgi:hypothetical protein